LEELKMATLTIRIPDDTHKRLKFLAEKKQISVNKLFEEFSTAALAEFDAENRFLAQAARGNLERGLALLDKIDKHFGR
jgi:predicted transcriptional regulator